MSTNDIAYCTDCHEKNNYKVVSQGVEMTVRGTEFSYIEKAAYCEVCGSVVYVPEINDQNVVSREEAYRKSMKIKNKGETK